MYKTRFLRSLMRPVVPILAKTPIKSYHLLLFRIVFALVSVGAIIFLDRIAAVVIFTIYQFVFLVDYADGALARLRGEFSHVWRRVDRTSHYLISAFLLAAVSLAYYKQAGSFDYLLIGLSGAGFTLMTFIVDTMWLAQKIDFSELKAIHNKKSFVSPFYSFLAIDGPFTLFWILFVLDLYWIAIIFLSALKFFILLKKINGLIKWTRKRK